MYMYVYYMYDSYTCGVHSTVASYPFPWVCLHVVIPQLLPSSILLAYPNM